MDIGYSLRPEHPLQRAANNADKVGASDDMSFDEFAEFVSHYDRNRHSVPFLISDLTALSARRRR